MDKYKLLTKRELEILELIAKGHSNKSVSRILNIANRTVDTHCSHLYKKLNCQSRGKAVHEGLKLNLLNTNLSS